MDDGSKAPERSILAIVCACVIVAFVGSSSPGARMAVKRVRALSRCFFAWN
jgi:hypothetical protein